MTENFRLVIGGITVDATATSTPTPAEVQHLVRERLLGEAAEHRRLADALAPAVRAAALAARTAANTPGRLLPELAEELDKPWDPAAFARSAVGRYADARRIREAENAAGHTLRSRRDRRAKHAAGQIGCGWDTVEYAQAKAEHSRLDSEAAHHRHLATTLEERAAKFRLAPRDATFTAVDRHREEAALKRAARPDKRAFAPGSWVRWQDPTTGRTRFGVVTGDPNAYTGPTPTKVDTRHLRYIVPDDGGDTLVMAARGSVTSGSWRCQRPEWDTTADVLPALAQDALFDAA
jgi:hypothetical protein